MHHFTNLVHLCLQLTLALSSVIQTIPAAALRHRASNVTTAALPAVGARRIRCDGVKYGTTLLEPSCTNAFLQIPNDRTIVEFGTRGGPVHFGVDLPKRWISGEVFFPDDLVERSSVENTTEKH